MSDNSKQKTCRVEFVPDGVGIEVPYGATILDAARKAGVFIDSLCGGEGVCGKCRVIVRRGEVQGGTTTFLTRDEIRSGYILACEALAASDLVVEVPPESRVRVKAVEFDIGEKRFSELAVIEKKTAKPDSLVRKLQLAVPPPSLENNRADLDRLEHALQHALGDSEFQMGLKVIRTLPQILRHARGHVIVTTAYRGALTELTEVVAGDTAPRNFGVAVDVGTTTIVAQLIDLESGSTLASAAKYNSQTIYGSDVIHRILWCTEYPTGLQQLQDRITGDINILIKEFQRVLHISESDITTVVAAGNTTMMHLLLGLDPQWIRREPYVGVSYEPPPFRAAEIGLTINPRGLLYSLPCVSAYVGADITGGVLAVGLRETSRPCMLIDVGTNGEIVIGNKDWMVCASASAGPAFEGAGTRHGMRAMRGAVDHVLNWSSSDGFSFSTIGDSPPIGFCGTAYVDLLAELLKMGVIDKTGRFNPASGNGQLRRNSEGVLEFLVIAKGEKYAERDLVITQSDLDNLLRTKGAIYAATKLLLRSVGLSLSDLHEIMVAGAFGNYLNVDNAIAIGLLPDMGPEKRRLVGNTSLAGAKMVALNREYYLQVRDIARAMTYLELSTDPHFMEEFTSACFLPHTNIGEFPSSKPKYLK